MTGKKLVLIAAGVGGAAWLYNYVTTKLDTVSKLNATMIGLQLGRLQFVNNQVLLDVTVKLHVTNGSDANATATGLVGAFYSADGITQLATFNVRINNLANGVLIPAHGNADVDVDGTINVVDSLASYLQNAKQIVLKATVTVNGVAVPITQSVAVGCACNGDDYVGAVSKKGKRSEKIKNTKELIAVATEKGIWIAKTDDGKNYQYSYNGYVWIDTKMGFYDFSKLIQSL